MNDHGLDVERIVREVLRRLESQISTAADAVAEPPRKPARPNGRLELCLDERVVTLAAVAGRLQSVRHVRLRSDAIVTPSVRDEFRKRNISVERSCSAAPPTAADAALVVALADTDFDPTALLAQVRGTSLGKSGLAAAVEKLVQHVRGEGQSGVLLTARTAPALCLANRQKGVRASLGGSVALAREARQAVGANLLVIDPAGRSLADLAKTLREFMQGGPPQCPAEFRDLL